MCIYNTSKLTLSVTGTVPSFGRETIAVLVGVVSEISGRERKFFVDGSLLVVVR